MLRITLSLLLIASLAGCDQPIAEKKNAADNKPATETPADTEESKPAMSEEMITQVKCDLIPIGESGVSGTVHFMKEGDMIHVSGTVTGLSPGKHGFHVHEHGDLSDKETGKSAGGHYNPTNKMHGRPSDEERHVGDLGNIEAGDDGTATISIGDKVISLNGPNSIVGRSIVVHAGEDKFTQPTGDAGARVAFGLIEQEPAAAQQ